MASINGVESTYAPILAALHTMQSNVHRDEKEQAHQYLEQFQRSNESWTIVFSILNSATTSNESRLFAATTLKGKIIFDLHQLPRESLPQLRDSLISLLVTFAKGLRPIRTQLCVCLANLALQMLEWKDVLSTVMNAFGNDAAGVPCLLEFLRVLPEEATEGRKIALSEDDLRSRTAELLEGSGEQVLTLLKQYAQSSGNAAKEPYFLDCITSWTREIPIQEITNSILMDSIMQSLQESSGIDSGVECLSAMFRETRDVDECIDTIKQLYPRVSALRPRIAQVAAEEDWETLKALTRVFAEAAESWALLIVRLPDDFRSLVEAVLECAACDKENDAISVTFNFWYELKQYLTLERYISARASLADIYSKLVDILMNHLQFPAGDSTDLFEGDRELEDRFREFRHNLGDVLKDCCEVIGVTECLQKPFTAIESWVATYGAKASEGNIPEWQKLEAPIFAMRAMGKEVPIDESVMLHRLIPLLLQIPDHEKVRFQAVMALGRYTEWTAKHPETLEAQLNFIMAAFQHSTKEVRTAAALSLRYFCDDCADLLKDFAGQLQQFYESVINTLPAASQEELTEGIASVIAKLPAEQTYPALKATCDPVIAKIVELAQTANTEQDKLAIADHLQLVTIFIIRIVPVTLPSQPHPVVQYCQEIFPTLAALATKFTDFSPVLERVCRCWRHMVLSYQTAMTPLLPDLADKLAAGFAASRQGCFLWATDSIIREFNDMIPDLPTETVSAVFRFLEQQITNFFRVLNDVPPEELPDVIEDFFRLGGDGLQYYSTQFIASSVMPTILHAACSALTVLKLEPLRATLQFLRDFVEYASDNPPYSHTNDHPAKTLDRSPTIQGVKSLVQGQGEILTQRVLTGMMYTFPEDCIPDASGVLLAMFQILPRETASWVSTTVNMLPAGSISQQEQERILRNIDQRIQSGETQRIRMILQDFTASYRRRNVAPREGLGRLEATRFRFNG